MLVWKNQNGTKYAKELFLCKSSFEILKKQMFNMSNSSDTLDLKNIYEGFNDFISPFRVQ